MSDVPAVEGARLRIIGVKEIEPDDAAIGTRFFLWMAGALVAGAIGWAAIGRLDVIASAAGEVVPSTQLKSIQHLEGGIVRAIRVREGMSVKQGQPLVDLEPTQSDADVQELTARTNSLLAEVARLEAEATGETEPKFPSDLAEREPQLVREAVQTFLTRRSRFESQLTVQRELVQQRVQEIQELAARVASDRESLKLLREQIKISEELLKDDLTNRMLHLNLLKEAATIEGRMTESLATTHRLVASRTEAEARLSGIRHAYDTEVREALEEKRRSLEEFSSRLRKYSDSLRRTTLRAPVDGVVKTLYITTVGGVVKAGATVVDLVPADDRLVIEARLPTQDVGYVHPGQTAMVKLASADAIRFGNLEGKVVLISPDTTQTAQGASFYRVRIETERDYFEQRGLNYRLVPGVQVICSILTGRRTVLEYVLDPFVSSYRTALRER